MLSVDKVLRRDKGAFKWRVRGGCWMGKTWEHEEGGHASAGWRVLTGGPSGQGFQGR
jgi:hypothetical protein